MADKEIKMLTVKEVSKITGIAVSTISLYCRENRFPNAKKETTQFGDFWLIPETDLALVEKKERGRPRKNEN